MNKLTFSSLSWRHHARREDIDSVDNLEKKIELEGAHVDGKFLQPQRRR
jgi:hypothetical protein